MSTEASIKPRQLQVARIRQEEEDSWISGEELYTEGSSDDEGGVHAHAHAHVHSHSQRQPIRITASPTPHTPTKADSPKSPVIQPSLSTTPSAASEPAEQTDPHLTETTRRLSLMGLEKVESVAKTPTSKDADEVEEQEEVMLWRPKRGSIKLPHIELDPPAPSLLEQVSG
ncbi:uncharacterized protein LOC135103156 [Scylla paramamosain]|uniref:uncharacterized protein LOC135103156 n=1 Tax=Scylla paramamosain TaxID=85552 RepID=UPI0030834B0D